MHIEVVNFHLNDLSDAEFRAHCEELAPAFVEVTAPTASVFTKLPVVLAVTFTCTVHVAFAGIVAPLTAMLVPPAFAVMLAPVHVLEAAGVTALTRFAG